MTTSPDLGIPYIAGQQAQPEVTHNDALNMLIALQKGAIDKDLNAPPGSPSNGDVYIVGGSPTGAWAGKANKIAIYTTTAWTFVPGNDSNGANIAMGARHEGLKIWVQDENLLYAWTGSAWAVAIDALSVKGADIASATTTNIAAATGDFVDVTGTTTITALGTAAAGVERTVRFTGALTLTHNVTSLILPGGANIATTAGDVARFRSLGSGNWLCVDYSRASGKALVAPAASEISNTPAGNIVATNVQAAINELDSEKLAAANNLSDLANAATARTNLGLVAGGAGDIWVEKAGDTMTGVLVNNLGSVSYLAVSPVAGVNIIGEVDAQSRILLDCYDSGGGHFSNFIFRKARYSAGNRAAVQNSDILGRFSWFGYGATTYSGARTFVQSQATENWTDTAQGARFGFSTTPNGSTSQSERLGIEQDGSLSMGGASNTVIDTNRIFRLRSYTVATLPTVGTAGRLAKVTDATAPTYNATVTGGGAVDVPVYDNGTNWTCH